MYTPSKNTKRKIVTGLLAVLATTALTLHVPQVQGLFIQNAFAHKADCAFCDLPVDESSEVVMKVGNKSIDYRCVYCAISQAKTEYPGSNLTIIAPTEKSSKATIKRTGGKWSVSPSKTVFIAEKVKHRQCQVGYHAFTSKAALAAWAKNNGYANKPLTLSQMVAVAKK
jgi:hypothetical protein